MYAKPTYCIFPKNRKCLHFSLLLMANENEHCSVLKILQHFPQYSKNSSNLLAFRDDFTVIIPFYKLRRMKIKCSILYFCILSIIIIWNRLIHFLVNPLANVFMENIVVLCSGAAVPNLFGTRGWFCGKHFFHGLGMGVVSVSLPRLPLISSYVTWFLTDHKLVPVWGWGPLF